ncbi:hypothetical protein PR202_gb10666 [Eleusine coracana subsp. coracana]|uniref:Bifunctional inhibitor/plant lipid transfer protein/seed storage helical domain-containing protein n=1 Tax=Eleusine coracana subsp. coracana TaxID=191504 RepID=A0AAV5ELB0_ELECO|nr:hypothetical protein PR202_gb10666 [Eleusine coracana subsp. coracana]
MAAARGTALTLLMAAVVASALVASASAQSGGCTSTLISLYPCLNYISGNVSTPPASCCSSLSSVVQSNPQCLCAALSGDSSALGGITINKDRALQLPKACNVQTPPASKCNSKSPSPIRRIFFLTPNRAAPPLKRDFCNMFMWYWKGDMTNFCVVVSATGGAKAPAGPATPATPSGPSTGAETGTGSKTTPTSPYLSSGGASLRGAASLVLAFAAVALYAVSAV